MATKREVYGMKNLPTRGICREGLDSSFEAEEARKSALILQARLLRENDEDEAAASKFAEVAAIEERLSDICKAKGNQEKSQVHLFSAASCWAQAGDFYHALSLCDALLAHSNLPNRLRRRAQDYARILRSRRAKWYADLAVEMAGSKVEA